MGWLVGGLVGCWLLSGGLLGCLLEGWDCRNDKDCSPDRGCFRGYCHRKEDIEEWKLPAFQDGKEWQVLCDTTRRMLKATCWLKDTQARDGWRPFLSCFVITTAESRGEGIWKLQGRWLCLCKETPFRLRYEKPDGSLTTRGDTDLYPQGSCTCFSELCAAQGRECGEISYQGDKLSCGLCPDHMACSDEGRCVCKAQGERLCQGDQLYASDSCRNPLGLQALQTCSEGCLSYEPFSPYSLCRGEEAAAFCRSKPDGSFCEGRSLVTCQASKRLSEISCRDGCKTLQGASEGQCLSRQGYHEIAEVKSGLCMTARSSAPERGTSLHLEPCQAKTSQLWRWKGDQIEHLSGLCLGVALHASEDGQPATLAVCKAERLEQAWKILQGGGLFSRAIQAYLEPYGRLASPGHRLFTLTLDVAVVPGETPTLWKNLP